MTRSLFDRAALVIRSLLRDNLLADHIVIEENQTVAVASEVVAELEAADEAGELVPTRDIRAQMAAVRADVVSDSAAAKLDAPDQFTQATADYIAGHERLTADTSSEIASLAGKYGNFQEDDLHNLALRDETGVLAELCSDIRRMAASLRRQNER